MLRTLLKALKAVGAFRVARWLTRSQLRILCYHGFSSGDESRFSPFMYIRPERFENRLRLLRDRGFPVISLAEAVERLDRGGVHSAEVVITLDDGWKSNLTLGLPLLSKYGYPATIYVITEHLGRSPTVFNMCVAYMLWKSTAPKISLDGLGHGLAGEFLLGSVHPASTEALVNATSHLSYAEKQALLPRLAQACGLRFDEVNAGGRFDLMTEDELREIAVAGIDLQLHSHEHCLSADDVGAVERQIRLNDAQLHRIKGSGSPHFCYPSGKYSAWHPDCLRRLGVASATTCDIGLVDPGADPLTLRRILDRDDADDLFFEAEMCGLMQIMRNIKFRFGRPQ